MIGRPARYSILDNIFGTIDANKNPPLKGYSRIFSGKPTVLTQTSQEISLSLIKEGDMLREAWIDLSFPDANWDIDEVGGTIDSIFDKVQVTIANQSILRGFGGADKASSLPRERVHGANTVRIIISFADWGTEDGPSGIPSCCFHFSALNLEVSARLSLASRGECKFLTEVLQEHFCTDLARLIGEYTQDDGPCAVILGYKAVDLPPIEARWLNGRRHKLVQDRNNR